MTEPAARQLTVGGLRLHFLDWGSRRPALVLLHDLGETADVWRGLAGELAGEFRVLAVDLRGHGESDWIDTYSPQEQGDDIGELVQTLNLAPAAIVGAGMGGRAALLLAARQGWVTERVVALDVGVRMYEPAGREAAEAIFALPRIFASADDYLRAWCALRAGLDLRRDGLPPADLAAERYTRQTSAGLAAPAFDIDGYQAYRAWSPGERVIDYHQEYHEVDCPVLLVRGADSPILSPEQAEETLASLPAARLVTVPAARHDLLADNPASLLAAILPFLRGG